MESNNLPLQQRIRDTEYITAAIDSIFSRLDTDVYAVAILKLNAVKHINPELTEVWEQARHLIINGDDM